MAYYNHLKEESRINEEKAFIENKYYKITVNSNGTINLSDKRLMKEYRELLIAEDGSDDGEEECLWTAVGEFSHGSRL